MQQINVALNAEEWDRLQRILAPNQTPYAFAKDTILRAIREGEIADPMKGLNQPIILEMVAALRARRWYLYQTDDYSDKNHREWLQGRFRKATKTEVADAIALFRTKVNK